LSADQTDVAAWPRNLGLDRYVQAFLDNHIDQKILGKLTEADVVALGVKSVGHRRVLLKSIAALNAAAAGANSTAASGTFHVAEQRQLTVLYCAWWASRPCRRSWIPKSCARRCGPSKPSAIAL